MAQRPHAHLREKGGGQLQLQALLLPQVPLQLVAQLERRQVLPRRQRRVVQLRQARLRSAKGSSQGLVCYGRHKRITRRWTPCTRAAGQNLHHQRCRVCHR